jgi:hypothetical protein
MGILRLIKHSDLIVEYDDGEDSNLFDFGEPKNAGIGQRGPLISGGRTSGQCMPLHLQRKVRMRPCCSLPGNGWAGILEGQANTSLRDMSIYS